MRSGVLFITDFELMVEVFLGRHDMKQNFRILLLSIFFMICSVSVLLAATVTIVPSGGNSFVVQGGGMNGVAGIDLTISYDASALSSPNIAQGSLVSGWTSMSNLNNAGVIRFIILSPTKTVSGSGNGQIATIGFGTKVGSGNITIVDAKMIDENRANVPVTIVPTGSTPPPEPEQKDTPIATTGSGSATPPSTLTDSPEVSSLLGTINLPQDTQPPAVSAVPESTPVVQPQTPATPVQPVKVSDSAPAAIEPDTTTAVPVHTSYIGIAERFRVYQGLRTPVAMTGLFQKPITDSIRQEPAIVVSDGKSGFKLTLALASSGMTAPNFAFSGAKLVSLKSAGGPGRWLVEATTQKNAQKVSVTIITGGSFVEYPVTAVLPMAAISGKEADFTEFLKDSGAKVPRFDLNGDGKHDYLDDYIYTGNYLILKGTGRK